MWISLWFLSLKPIFISTANFSDAPATVAFPSNVHFTSNIFAWVIKNVCNSSLEWSWLMKTATTLSATSWITHSSINCKGSTAGVDSWSCRLTCSFLVSIMAGLKVWLRNTAKSVRYSANSTNKVSKYSYDGAYSSFQVQ